MRRRLLALAACLLATPAAADLTQVELDAVGARPSVLVMADFDCSDLCDPLVAQTAASLDGTGLAPGEDYRLAVVGIDPRDGEEARARFLDGSVGHGVMREALLAPPMPEPRLARLTDSLGFRYAYDEARDRFAHPVLAYVLTPEGRVSRVFPSLAIEPAEMRRALVEAGDGVVGSLVERLVLTCYGFDPLTGRYSLAIERSLSVASALFAVGVLGAIALAIRRERKT